MFMVGSHFYAPKIHSGSQETEGKLRAHSFWVEQCELGLKIGDGLLVCGGLGLEILWCSYLFLS